MEDLDDEEYIDDKFIIDKYLSYGYEGEVYLVTERKTNNKYAAKISFTNKKNLDNEIIILDKLKKNGCENILNIVDSGKGIIKIEGREPEIKQYLILELAPNRDIGEYIYLEQKGFGEVFSKVIFYKMVKCIKSIHDLKYCHRDIKIDNFLLDEKFNPKINDFGFAREYGNSLKDFLGTQIYKAPEILKGKFYDGFKVDIFSLGVTLFFLTNGLHGFKEANEKNKYYKYIYDGNLDSYWDIFKSLGLSDDFKDLFIGMVSYYPNERYSLEKILEHNWFGKIRNMNDEELEQYKAEIKLDVEFKSRKQKILQSLESKLKKNEKKEDKKKEDSRGISFVNESHFKQDAKPDYIKINKFMNYYIDIEGNLQPANFMDLLFDKIDNKFKDNKNYDCFIEADKTGKFKLKLFFEKEEKEKDEDENELEEDDVLIMEIILYQTPKGYLLRFVKEKMNKGDFIEKFINISQLVRELVE